jgi:hypothetical protein
MAHPDIQPPPFRHRLTPDLEPGTAVRVYGVVTAVRKSRLIVFFDLLYTTGSIQVAAESHHFTEGEWSLIRHIGKEQRVYAEGVLGKTNSGTTTLFISTLPTVASSFVAPTLAATRPDYQSIGAMLLTARVRAAAEEFFESQGYLRIDTRFLSAFWQHTIGVKPLLVNYQGFGRQVYIVPSPAQQLLEAIIATGENKVYSSTVSFTTTYRAPTDGVETAILMARTLGLDLETLIILGKAIIQHVLVRSGVSSMPDVGVAGADVWQRVEGNIGIDILPKPIKASGEVGTYEVQLCSDENNRKYLRFVLPSGDSILEVLIENSGSILLGILTFHIERVLVLLRHEPIRRLSHVRVDEPS